MIIQSIVDVFYCLVQVDTALIPQAEINDPTSELTGSLCAVYNTYDFEQGLKQFY